MTAPLPHLLVSVRSAAEAVHALDGGADLIDVKEPTRGPLGPAATAIVREVITVVAARRPVSAALGEWREWTGSQVPDGLRYVKWGLAETAEDPTTAVYGMRAADVPADPVLVAYGDHRRVGSPDPEWLAERAASMRFAAFLLDTAIKDDSTLLDWVTPATLARIRFRLADAGVPVALAGRLDEPAIRRLGPLCPDWFAVRGAACVGGRGGIVSADRVRHLKGITLESAHQRAG
jgi:(5-formylfuran-3-yl)methyl phosphate synthase